MPEPLTKIERRILNYLVDYLKENTYQPSIREIGKRFGIKSTKTVSDVFAFSNRASGSSVEPIKT